MLHIYGRYMSCLISSVLIQVHAGTDKGNEWGVREESDRNGSYSRMQGLGTVHYGACQWKFVGYLHLTYRITLRCEYLYNLTTLSRFSPERLVVAVLKSEMLTLRSARSIEIRRSFQHLTITTVSLCRVFMSFSTFCRPHVGIAWCSWMTLINLRAQ